LCAARVYFDLIALCERDSREIVTAAEQQDEGKPSHPA
jgi:hypothetical protein